MSTETQVAEPVRSVTTNGVTVTSAMSPTEIFNAHLKAQGAAPVNSNDQARVGMGPPLHVHNSYGPGMGGLMHAEISAATANPAPAPQQLEKQNAMPAAAQPANVDVDQAGVDALNKAYAEKMTQYEAFPPSKARDENIAKFRAMFHEEMQEFHEGRKLGEKRSDFQARRGAGGAPPGGVAAVGRDPLTGVISFRDGDGKITNSPPGMGEALDIAAKASSKDGWAPASAITGPLLHGYNIPQNREYNVSEAVHLLRLARIGGLSQGQVDKIINAGWNKA